MAIDLTPVQQRDIISYIRDSVNSNYRPNSTEYRELMTRIYESLSTFEMPDTGDVLTRFKVNKAHEIVNKVVPRVFAKSPKFQVSARTDAFYEKDAKATGEERKTLLERNQKMVLAVQDYLTVLFEDQDLQESLKLWVKAQVVYGNGFAQVIPKIEIKRNKDKNNKVTEKLIGIKPTIDIVSWTEMYYDPRYKKLKDMPWYVRIRDWVRLQELHFIKDAQGNQKYFNLDKIKSLSGSQFTDADTYKQQIYSVTGVSDIVAYQGIDMNSLSLQVFEGKYTLTDDARDEKLYEITVVDNAVVIGIEEITQFSIVDIKAHEDVELFPSTGFVAPILGLTDEINFQKNAYATSISKALNRSYFWWPNSWVDPNNLVWDRPWQIIVCPDGVEKAQKDLVEQENKPLPSQYFANMNDYNRDINNLTHTTDVSGQSWQTSQINTATGARIAFFESNSVIAEVRKNFERGARELAYKLLQWTVDNLEDNIVIKKIDSEGFLEINKEALKDAVERYEIGVEAGSSAFDEVETKRDEAIAVKNILTELKKGWANVDLDEAGKTILRTFEGYNADEIFKKQLDLWITEWGIAKWGDAGALVSTSPAALTENVAKGGITAGI